MFTYIALSTSQLFQDHEDRKNNTDNIKQTLSYIFYVDVKLKMYKFDEIKMLNFV